MTTPDREGLLSFYLSAKQWVLANSDWLDSVDPNRTERDLSPTVFLREYAYAVYVSGFKARTVRDKLDQLVDAWNGFEPDRVDRRAHDRSLLIINHEGKAGAILQVAGWIRDAGWPAFKSEYCADPDSLVALPFVGPTNRDFLARNLGLDDRGKCDRWLMRAVERFGYPSLRRLLDDIQRETGDGPGRADLIIWAFLSDNPDGLDG